MVTIPGTGACDVPSPAAAKDPAAVNSRTQPERTIIPIVVLRKKLFT
jgi:hypothetical protein